MTLKDEANVYYCGLCETAHARVVAGATCPTCGRQYCVNSINQAKSAGMDKCPFCGIASFDAFPDIKPKHTQTFFESQKPSQLEERLIYVCTSCGHKNPQLQKFCINCGASLQDQGGTSALPRSPRPVYPPPRPTHPPPRILGSSYYPSPKSRTITLILCLFLGYLGLHEFYVGKTGMGVLYFFTIGLFGIGWLISLISILFGNFRDSDGARVSQW